MRQLLLGWQRGIRTKIGQTGNVSVTAQGTRSRGGYVRKPVLGRARGLRTDRTCRPPSSHWRPWSVDEAFGFLDDLPPIVLAVVFPGRHPVFPLAHPTHNWRKGIRVAELYGSLEPDQSSATSGSALSSAMASHSQRTSCHRACTWSIGAGGARSNSAATPRNRSCASASSRRDRPARSGSDGESTPFSGNQRSFNEYVRAYDLAGRFLRGEHSKVPQRVHGNSLTESLPNCLVGKFWSATFTRTVAGRRPL
jgi:hypothetical protein